MVLVQAMDFLLSALDTDGSNKTLNDNIFTILRPKKKKKEQRFLFPSSSRMLWSCGRKRKEETDATHTHIHVFIDKSGQRWIFSSVSFRSPTSLFYVWALFDSVSGAIISFIIANLSKRLTVNNFQNQNFFFCSSVPSFSPFTICVQWILRQSFHVTRKTDPLVDHWRSTIILMMRPRVSQDKCGNCW